jgi:hypothetical protein
MVNNTIFKLTHQTNKLSPKVQSSVGPVSYKAMDMTMTVRKQDYNNAINKINYNVLSRMLINSRNYKKNISNSTLGIRDTNIVVQETVATVQETVATVIDNSVTGAADGLTGEFTTLEVWPVTY